jgi:phenylacetate-coenzyme A ligase PaaK-like adenylate-forming protein
LSLFEKKEKMKMRHLSLENIRDSIEKAEYWSDEERKSLRHHRLEKLVSHALNHSPFFAALYKDLPENFGLEDLPVTSKKQLMPRFDHWVTDKTVTMERLNHYFSDLKNIGKPFLENYTVLTTSGTTGQPLRMVRDPFHSDVHGSLMAERLFKRFQLTGLLDTSRNRCASVLGTGGFHSAVCSFERMRKNSHHPENLLLCSILEPIPEIVEKLNAFNPSVLTGYPSVLAVLAKEKIEGRLTISPTAIACSAEQLTDHAWNLMKNAFDAEITNSFCSTEGGEVAFNCKHGNMHLNDDWVIVEPVDQNNAPVTDGHMSSAVLVTNLASYLQPVIRYKIEDSVIIEKEKCPCKSMLPVIKIMGRSGDNLSFVSNGKTRAVAPIMLNFIITKTDGILQFQFVQTSETRLELRALYSPEYDKKQVDEKISTHVHALLRTNDLEDVTFEISDTPPVASKGGKIKTVTEDFH